MSRAIFALLAAGLAAACSEARSPCAPRVVSSDVACATGADCVAAGLGRLSCIDGVCRLGCERDADCRPAIDDAEPLECRAMGGYPAAVCEGQVCVPGCPDAPCAAGEVCAAGRCALAYEGFEVPEGRDFVDLAALGFGRGLDRPLENRSTRIAWVGRRGCNVGDERCAGPASAGERFAVVGTQPTPPRGTAIEGPTCRACACCVECVLAPPSAPPDLAACPAETGGTQAFACPASTPPVCAEVCAACERCPVADRPSPPERLLACEVPAAARACPACVACDRETAECRDASCPTCASAPAGQECSQCVRARCLGAASCGSCTACEDAADCELSTPGSATCEALRARCDALGPEGCFTAAIAYRREQLTDLEQALVSPPIDLLGVAGRVVLQLEHVPFDVGLEYRPGIQGTDPATWARAPQELRVELCGGGCDRAEAWLPALTPEGAAAVLPPEGLRDNGLTLGTQRAIDWRSGRVVVEVPEALRTRELRYRLLPRLGEGVLVGIDEILVRRVP